MQIVTSVAAMQRLALVWRRRGPRVALVPTMGYLHDGHLSLVRRARQAAGRAGKVVVSIYVNPTQFGANEDLARYPRDFARDCRLCRGAGVDVIFAPTDAQMYPVQAGVAASTFVVEESLSRGMEGASRPGHFRGVTTVVAKLFNLVQPKVAVFGEKDWQQTAVIQRMTRDLNLPVRIIVAATVREADGLALSSRNKYLDSAMRPQATVLWRAIQEAQLQVYKSPRPVSASWLKARLRRLIGAVPAARLDYLEFFEPTTLTPVAKADHGTRMALAIFIGNTRLIDNAAL